jgi:hypothetical protein
VWKRYDATIVINLQQKKKKCGHLGLLGQIGIISANLPEKNVFVHDPRCFGSKVNFSRCHLGLAKKARDVRAKFLLKV